MKRPRYYKKSDKPCKHILIRLEDNTYVCPGQLEVDVEGNFKWKQHCEICEYRLSKGDIDQ